ncbi:hypothetical protein SAMN06265371_106222 [Lutibacter agarilyticus]|uniref:Uncharacterized protein n=1 Tax=Lutibacter agarilyticus TaxID=1109740 RepID=A0A238XS55_9FLAO|nr:hypothetical protein [Lutibacter agarilyticus]SNR60849.1 hypothetical protein SAMN06265371_106222 [Lutibacter agarilyticus]
MIERNLKTKPTATEKLDSVLNYLNDNRKLAYHCSFKIPIEYSKPKSIIISNQDVLNVLDKLERDNMVRIEIQGDGNGNPTKHYTINMDGEVLLQDGGYTQKIKNDKARIRNMEIKDNLLVMFSFVAAVSTLLLGILGILNLYCGS